MVECEYVSLYLEADVVLRHRVSCCEQVMLCVGIMSSIWRVWFWYLDMHRVLYSLYIITSCAAPYVAVRMLKFCLYPCAFHMVGR